jgi:hypothetical protein
MDCLGCCGARQLVYNRLAGSRLLRGVAIRKYQKALINKYQLLSITFRPERPLKMREVYVPLQLVGDGESSPFDAYPALINSHKVLFSAIFHEFPWRIFHQGRNLWNWAEPKAWSFVAILHTKFLYVWKFHPFTGVSKIPV